MSETTPYIIEATPETFRRDAIDRSADLPVVVDFWAAWCAPCRMLTPVLEKLALEYDGRFVLVKAETERLPEVAAEFGVRSIPAVYGLRDGKVADAFVGALPEPAIRAWLDRLLPTPVDALVAEAKGLEPTDPRAAEDRYRSAIELDPNDPRPRIGLARVLLSQGRTDESRALIEGLEARGYLEPEAERLKAEVTLRLKAGDAGGVEACRAALAASPADPALQLNLAEALAAAGQHAEALALLLALVEEGGKEWREKARKSMVEVFHLLPEDSELLGEYRRRLSAALY